MRTDHNKLVRDRIPEIIAASGRRCAVEEMDAAAYRQALLDKLVEEAREAQEAAAAGSSETLLSELADLREAIAAAMAAFGLREEQLTEARHRRREERGAFTRRLRLLWTE
jgi:predicted house-cleaning noncanonical NTP pyrophosphatase (MazG superfamily)